MLTYFLFVSWSVCVVSAIIDDTSTALPSSCIGLQDGYHWMKLLSDDVENNIIYPPVHVLCDNHYMILDLNHDHNIQSYFHSFDSYHYALYGADPQTSVNWQQWFIPSSRSPSSNHQFLLSPHCNTCDATDSILQDFNTKTAYYMTGTMFGCLSTYKAERDCSWDWNTYECKYCTMVQSDAELGYHVFSSSDEEYDHWMTQYKDAESKHDPNAWWFAQVGLCGVYSRASDTREVAQNREECFGFDNEYNPSIGSDGRFCQCYKPETEDITYTISTQTLAKHKDELHGLNDDSQTPETQSNEHIHKLYQSDFTHGTYRIRASGTYLIMEDIEFDFNAGDLFHDPNDNRGNGGAWWPHMEQMDAYPGAYDTRDEYFMGFFAGITIEANDVTLDLNGFEVRMSRPFYYQQRFFACIALNSVVFNLNQGPGIFGTNPQYAEHVVIKNGKIGLSSHHGIHGQGNKHVLIENVHIHSFETHGVQLSAFDDIHLKDVDIGPSSDIAYLSGEYAYARFTLQRLERIQNDPSKYKTDVFPFAFNGRKEAIHDIQDIIDPLRESMDMAFKYVMSDRETYISETVKKLFINADGVPYGAVMYGLFLNLYFANVFQIHPSLKHSANAVIENVEIHDLKHKTREYLRLDKFSVTPYANPYNAALDARSVLGDDIVDLGYDDIPWDQVQYVGDVLIDAHIALDLCTEDWGEKGLMMIGEEFSDWALGRHQWSSSDPHLHPFIGCNGDRMTHSAKGTMGIRIDGVDDITFDTISIHHLHEQSLSGSTLCSEYWDGNMENFFGTGHFLQNSPYLYGYSGNMMHGIFADFTSFVIAGESNIYQLFSDTGLVHAIGAYPSVNIDIVDDFTIKQLASGIALLDVDTSAYKHPYHPCVAKPFHIVDEWIKYENIFYSKVNVDKSAHLNINCVFGRDGIENDLEMMDVSAIGLNSLECNQNNLNFDFVAIQSFNDNAENQRFYLKMMVMVAFVIFIWFMCKRCCYRKAKYDRLVSYGSI